MSQEQLKTFKITSNIEKISDDTFYGCSDLKQIEIDEESNLHSIGKNAFENSGLEQINIPETVITIEVNAFKNTHLTSIYLPNKIASIGTEAFSGCILLSNVTFGEEINIERLNEKVFENCAIEEIIIPNSVYFIQTAAFKNNNKLSSIYIPNSVIQIQSESFYNCSSLKNITFHEDMELELIAKNSFEKCGIEEIVIPSTSLTTFEENSFANCKELKNVALQYVIDLKNVFVNCPKLQMIVVGELDADSDVVFTLNSNILFIYMGSSEIPSEGNCYFSPIENSILIKYINEDELDLKEVDFCNKKITNSEIIITEVGEYSIGEINNSTMTIYGLQNIESAKNIDQKTQIKEIIITENIKGIGARSFDGYSSLEKVTIQGELMFINKFAFRGCTALKTVIYNYTSEPSFCESNSFEVSNNNITFIVHQNYNSTTFCGKSLIPIENSESIENSEEENNENTNDRKNSSISISILSFICFFFFFWF